MSYKYLQHFLPNIEMKQEQPSYKSSVSVVMWWSHGDGVRVLCMNIVSAETLVCVCNITSLVSCTLIKPKHDACFT